MYHITCPISGNTFDYDTVQGARNLAVKAMRKAGDSCNKRIPIKDGKKVVGRIWRRKDGTIMYSTVPSKGGKAHRVGGSGELLD